MDEVWTEETINTLWRMMWDMHPARVYLEEDRFPKVETEEEQ